MVSRNLQTQGKELHHPIFIQLHELTKFSREHQRRRMAEVYKTEISVRMYFAVKHGRDFTGIVLLAYLKCVASGNRLRQAQVDVFKQLRRRFPVMIKFRKHEGMEGIVHGGGDLRRNKAMSLSVGHQDTCNVVQLR